MAEATFSDIVVTYFTRKYRQWIKKAVYYFSIFCIFLDTNFWLLWITQLVLLKLLTNKSSSKLHKYVPELFLEWYLIKTIYMSCGGGGIWVKEGSAHNLYSTDEFSEHQIPLKAHCVLILNIHYAKLIEWAFYSDNSMLNIYILI